MNLILSEGQIAIVHIDESLKNAVHMQEKEKGFRSYFEEKKLDEIQTILNYSNKDVLKAQKSRCLKHLKELIHNK